MTPRVAEPREHAADGEELPMKIVFVALALVLLAPTRAYAEDSQSLVPMKCKQEAKKGEASGFSPRAITLTRVIVRAQIPEYSLLKGQWQLGRQVDVLPAGACLAILDRSMVGQVQIWYSVKYKKDPNGLPRIGWIWGATEGIDAARYIGGDTEPQGPKPSASPTGGPRLSDWFVSNAYAQADIPADDLSSGVSEADMGASGPPPDAREGTARENLYAVPLLGVRVSFTAASAGILFLTMVVGMIAKAFWDATERKSVLPNMKKILRPILISPITFSAFWGALQIQQANAGFSLTAALYAFQIGFMWQHVLERRVAST